MYGCSIGIYEEKESKDSSEESSDEENYDYSGYDDMIDDVADDLQEGLTEDFNNEVVSLVNDEEAKGTLKAIVNDLDNKRGLAFMPSVVLSNEITNQYLEKLGFSWPEITFDYIEKIIRIILSSN